MGEQALFWTGEGLQFEARTGHGLPFAVGGERDGDGAKPADHTNGAIMNQLP